MARVEYFYRKVTNSIKCLAVLLFNIYLIFNHWILQKEEEERMRREEAEKKAIEAESKRKRLEEAEKKRQAMMAAQKEKQQAAGKLSFINPFI